MTPTPRSSSNFTGSNRVSLLSSMKSTSQLTREKSQLVRERYRQLEEQAQRPLMLPSVRSFSYDVPTQAAEMEVMMKAESSSPPPVRTHMPLPPRPQPAQVPAGGKTVYTG